MRWEEVDFDRLYAEPSRNGITRPRRVRGRGFKMVNMGELFANSRISNPVMDLVPMDEREVSTFGLQALDLLFARQSLMESGAGQCSIVLTVPEITCFESHLIRVRLEQAEADPRFYHYYFSGRPGRSRIEAIITGAAQKGIRGSELAKIQVHKPVIQVQRRIADVLSAYDDLIENNNRRMALLEESIHLLYREWFVYLRFPGHERVKIVDGVPEGWNPCAVGSICDVIRGKSYRSAELDDPSGRPFITLKNIDRGGGFRLPGLKTYSGKFKPGQVCQVGDILVAVTDMGQKREVIARAGRVPFLATLEGAVFSMDLVKVVPCSAKESCFVYWLLRASSFPDEVKNHANGVNVLHLKPARITEYEILMPPSSLREIFSEEVAPAHEQYDLLWRSTTKLREARDLLLPRLMDGRIPV